MSASTMKRRLRAFDAKARRVIRAVNPVPAMQKAWKSVMKRTISSNAAKVFVRHYAMTKKAKKAKTQRGGAGAPLDYVMGPGAAAFSTTPYGQFTTDISVDPASLDALGKTIPEIAQLKDCGVDRFPNNPSLAQSSGMVGGARKHRRASRNKHSRKHSRGRKTTRKQRGGDLFSDLRASMTEMSRPAGFDPVPGAPHSWTNQSHGVAGYIDPSQVSQLGEQARLVNNMTWGPFTSTSS